MKKLIQENGPDSIWIQTWNEEGEEVPEPVVFSENDEWSAQMFNYFFLGAFGNESEGSLNTEHGGYEALKTAVEGFFSNGSLSEIHQRQTNIWGSETEMADTECFWFTVGWNNFSIDGLEGPAVGFFFSRNNENYLSLNSGEPVLLRGLPMKKPEFACLLMQEPAGEIRMFCQVPQGGFWSESLFPFIRKTDDAFHAREFFKMCKSFSEDVLVKEQHKPREEQVEFLSDSLSFAEQNKSVNFKDFKQDVLKEPAIIDAFDQYQEEYAGRKQWSPPDQFAVSEQSQNQAKKFVKSIIKLDKNFHIYVHGNKERIEKGFDSDKRLHFYTLWFEAET